MRTSFFKCALALLLAWAAAAQAAEPAFRTTHRQVLQGEVKWDYLAYDGKGERLFITRGDHVDVFDTTLRRVVGSVGGTAGVHGVAFAPEIDKGFTSNGASDTVTVFELSSLKIIATLPTGKNPDAITYDPLTRRVFTANANSGDLTVIDAVKNEVVGTVAVGGSLEFSAVDGKGRLYVNIEDSNAVAVVDTARLLVLARHDIAPCAEPTGMDIDRATGRLFVVCRNQKMVVLSGASGAILATVNIGQGCDAVAYDQALNLVFTSNGEGTMTVVAADSYTVRQTVATQRSARTLALDHANHRIYAVAAEAEGPVVAGVKPRLKPGTFTLLTVSR